MEQKRSYTILALALASLNGLVLFAVAVLYLTKPDILQGLVQVELIVGLASLCLLYYLSAHHYLRRRHQGFSTLIMSLVTTANLLLVIGQTGGLDSPFYSLWLLAIVASGIFGPIATISVLLLTLAGHLAGFAQHQYASTYLWAHAAQLGISLLAGGLAEWVYYRGTVDRKQAVISLSGRLSEEQLKAQALMSSMADGVIVVDQKRNVQLINRAAQEMTGWDEASAKNIDYRLILKLKTAQEQDIIDSSDPFVESWNKQASIVRNDLVTYTRADRRIALSMSIAPIYNAASEITGGIAVFRDISQEKEVERTRNEFISTASHEMRTPVAALEGYIALALNPKVATIDDRARNYLMKAHDNTQHLGALFRDLLSATNLDEGMIAKNLGPVNLTELLQDIASDMHFEADKKGLSMNFVLAGSTDPKTIVPSFWISADPERMREVLMNLVENAMKFTPEGGITLAINGTDKGVTVSVQDTGIGIPKEDIGHLFQKFYRVDNSATRTIGGTGLGLYLCRTLIELFNGHIWVESEFGKGSSFNFTLPRIDAPKAAKLPVPVVTQPTKVAVMTPAAPTPQPIASAKAAPITITVPVVAAPQQVVARQ